MSTMNRKRRENSTRKCKKQSGTPVMRESETPKALLNDVVLQNIFKFLGYKDLKSCRQVGNITWLRNSKKAWWARTKVKITGGETGSKCMKRYLKQTQINSNAINHKLEKIQGIFYGFWENFGHSLKYLDLWCCSFRSQQDFRHAIYSQCPNLEKLVGYGISSEHMHDVVEPVEWQEPQFVQQNNLKAVKLISCQLPVSWMEFLSHFPKLQDLQASVENADILKAISIIRQHNPKMLKLKHIKINIFTRDDFEEPIRSVFLDSKLSLETIHINFGLRHPETLVDILDVHANSVKDLQLAGEDSPTPIDVTPRQPLHQLEELIFLRCLFTADIFKHTPNLRVLQIYYDGTHNLLKSFDPSLKVTTCKELALRVSGRWRDTPNSDLAFFVHAFPNVEDLSVDRLNNSKFSLICEHWTKLVTFCILEETQVDIAGLLGFDPDSENKAARKPNITNLKDLQTFTMVVGKQAANGGMMEKKTARIVLKELETLPGLQKFELHGSGVKNEHGWTKVFAKYSGN